MLNYSCEGQLRTLRYSFEKIRNIDDIAIRLINGATDDGMIRISINPAVSCLEYDVAKLLPAGETDAFSKVKELAVILSDLKQVLDKLSGYHIDHRYIPEDLDGVFKEPVSGKTMFALTPCIEIFGDEEHPELQLVKAIVREGIQKAPIDQDTVHRMENVLSQDTDAGHLIRLLLQILEDDYPECSRLDKRILPKPLLLKSNPVFDGVKTEKAAETIPEITEIKEEPVETPSAQTEDDESRILALKESIRAEIIKESAAKRNAYLVRRKKDEIISLSKDVFVVGKIPEFCDYVIADNPAISRLHAIIRYNEAADDYSIIDCDTTNHTYLNGRRIPEEHAEILKDQMIIHMASEEFHFRR